MKVEDDDNAVACWHKLCGGKAAGGHAGKVRVGQGSVLK